MTLESKTKSELLAENIKLQNRIDQLEHSLSRNSDEDKLNIANTPAQNFNLTDEKIASVFHNAADGIVYMDKKANIIDTNPALSEITGIPKAELVGKNAFELARRFLKAKDIPRVINSIKLMLSGQPIEHFELQYDNVYFDITIPTDPKFSGFTAIFKDITKRKLSEEKLKQSEERFRSLVETMHDGVIRIDRKGEIEFVNEAAEVLLGYHEGELLGENLVDTIIEKSSRPVELQKNKLRLKGLSDRYEVYALTKDGKKLLLLLSAVPIRSQEGKITGSVGIFSDITEKKKYEIALEESEELFRKAFHTSPDSININRLEDGVYVNINNGFEKITGYSVDDVIGKSSLEINIWNESADREKLVRGLKKHGRVENLEARFRLKNGDVIRGLMSASVIEINKVPHILSVTRNIEDMKIAQDSLVSSEATLASIFKVAPIAIGLVDDRVFRKVNDRMCEMTGYSHSELIGVSAQILYDSEEEYLRVGEDKYSQIMKKGTGSVDTKWKCKNGEIIDIEMSSTPLDTNDLSKGVIFTALDVTEQKRSKDALQESEQRFRSIFESAITGIAFGDEKTSLILTNKALQKILGYTSEELYGMNIGDFTFKEDLQRENLLLRQLAENKINEYTIEKRYVRKNKELIWVNVSVSVIRDDKGKPKFYVGVVQDINDKKIAAEALRESEHIFSSFMEHSPIYIFFKDENMRSLRLSENYSDMLGKPMKELLGKNMFELFPSELAESMVEDDKRILEQGRQVEIIEELNDRIYSTIKFPVKMDDEKSFLAGYTIDITDRNKAEKALKQSEEQYRALAAKQLKVREDERIHIARELHDHLGQGLTGLKMDISWMANKLMSGEYEKIGSELRDKAKSIIELIDDNIKAVRKMSSELRPNVLDYLGLEAAIEWQANEFQNRSGISCKLNSSIKSLTLKPIYSTNIFRIFQEILTNIIRHSKASNVRVKLSESSGNLVLVVNDDGRGIDTEEIININSLGLLGMKERASLLNGQILFEGRPGGGTKVTLKVPLNEVSG